MKFELPSTGDSVLEELLEALKQLVTTVQELLVSKLANARRDVVKLIKSSYNILADAPLEFKRAQWDMLTVTSRMFALKSNVQALLEGKTVVLSGVSTLEALKTRFESRKEKSRSSQCVCVENIVYGGWDIER